MARMNAKKKKPRAYDYSEGTYFSPRSYGVQADPGVPPLHAVLGNSKLGKYTMIVSLTPVASCLPKVPCGNPDACYAIKFFRMYPSVRRAYTDNLKLAKKSPSLFEESVRRVLNHAKRIDLFRWWSSGDFTSQDVVDSTIQLAHEFPKIPFLAFTKRYDFDFRSVPKNYSIIFSQWPGWTPPRPAPAGAMKAWVEDPDYPDPRIPKNNFLCPGNCTTCRYCWNIYKYGLDVVFAKH